MSRTDIIRIISGDEMHMRTKGDEIKITHIEITHREVTADSVRAVGIEGKHTATAERDRIAEVDPMKIIRKDSDQTIVDTMIINQIDLEPQRDKAGDQALKIENTPKGIIMIKNLTRGEAIPEMHDHIIIPDAKVKIDILTHSINQIITEII